MGGAIRIPEMQDFPVTYYFLFVLFLKCSLPLRQTQTTFKYTRHLRTTIDLGDVSPFYFTKVTKLNLVKQGDIYYLEVHRAECRVNLVLS